MVPTHGAANLQTISSGASLFVLSSKNVVSFNQQILNRIALRQEDVSPQLLYNTVESALYGLVEQFKAKRITERELRALFLQLKQHDTGLNLPKIFAQEEVVEVLASHLSITTMVEFGCPDIDFCSLDRAVTYVIRLLAQLQAKIYKRPGIERAQFQRQAEGSMKNSSASWSNRLNLSGYIRPESETSHISENIREDVDYIVHILERILERDDMDLFAFITILFKNSAATETLCYLRDQGIDCVLSLFEQIPVAGGDVERLVTNTQPRVLSLVRHDHEGLNETEAIEQLGINRLLNQLIS